MSARLSSYVIFTELDDSDKKYMLVHGCTGAIDIASEGIVSYLRSEEILTPESAPFSQKTWDTLMARGYITTKTAEEEYAFARRMAEVLHRRSKLFNSFILIPSYDCNFRCPYCIEGQMSGDGKNWSKRAFTREMVDRAYEAMSEIGDIVLGPDAYLGGGVFGSNYNLTRIPKIVWPASNYPTRALNFMFQGNNRLRSVETEIPEGCAFFPSNYVSTNDYNYSVRTYIKLNPGRPTVSFSMGTTVSRNDANINVVSTAKNMADILMNLPQVSEQTVTLYGRSVETLYPEAIAFAESQGWTVVFD